MTAARVHTDIRSAFRQRLLALILADTGTASLTVSGATYSRASGSFIDDGFDVGDEIVASGFSASGNNGRSMITAITATTMTVDRTLATASATSARLVSGLPQGRAWEGREFQPVLGQPWIRESFRPLVSRPRSLGAGGTIEHQMTANLSLFYPSRKGTLPVERLAGAMLDAFAPGTSLAYGQNAGIIQQCERSPLIEEADWISVPVIVSITAYTSR